MIKVYRINHWNGAFHCQNCEHRATTRLTVLRADGGARASLDFCDRCARRGSDALMDRERKKALKDLLGKPWKLGQKD